MSEKVILVVEDNPDHLELTVMTLKDQGVKAEIVEARDGAIALQYLFGHGPHAGRDTRRQPALILLDVNLPKLSGLDVLRCLRRNPLTALVPVVMFSSSSERPDVLACYEAGANGYVQKPVNFGKFTEKLNCLQAYWLGVNESITPL